MLSEHCKALLSPTTYTSIFSSSLLKEQRDHELIANEREVAFLETHLSWLFFVGNLTLKVKKPLKFEFVDFSTLEKRKFFCEEELRLNRRYSPELYLAVVQICRSKSNGSCHECSYSVEPGDVQSKDLEVVDYGVLLKKFDQEGLLDKCIKNQQLHPLQIDRLASKVADFHMYGAEVCKDKTRFGTHQDILQPALETLGHMRTMLHSLAQQSSIDVVSFSFSPEDALRMTENIEEWIRERFNSLTSLISTRKEQGFIRECHGDLHLGNIFLRPPLDNPNSDVLLFDSLEFNETFRWIDVMNDLGFLTMDLRYHSRDDLANRLLNVYLSRTGDYEGIPLLKFYEAYRSTVRAKVALIRAEQSMQDGMSDSNRICSNLEDTLGYLRWTIKHTSPRRCRPKLYLMCGLSGSGKSTVAKILTNQVHGIRLSSDVERRRNSEKDRPVSSTDDGNDHHSDHSGSMYSPTRRLQVYQTLLHQSQILLSEGYHVIVDATFLSADQRALFYPLSSSVPANRKDNLAGNDVVLVETQASVLTMKRRIHDRQQRQKAEALSRSEGMLDVSDATVQVLEQQIQEFAKINVSEESKNVLKGTAPMGRIVQIEICTDAENGKDKSMDEIGNDLRKAIEQQRIC